MPSAGIALMSSGLQPWPAASMKRAIVRRDQGIQLPIAAWYGVGRAMHETEEPMPGNKIRNDVADIEETGVGKPLLLLHSLLADRSVFDPVVEALARERRVLLPDLLSFRASDPTALTIEGIADQLAGLFDGLGMNEKPDVLGNGLGGLVASALAIRHGGRIGRLVLAGTGVGFSEQGREAFRAMAKRVRDDGMAGVVEIAMKRLFPDSFIAANPDIVALRRSALLDLNPDIFAQACEALVQLDLTAGIGGIANPTLVVVGELDAATPPAMARTLAASIDGATLVELPGIGHAPMAQAPDVFLAAISGFLGLAPG